MEFKDGDKVIGTYGGNEWTRVDGIWHFTGPRLEQYKDVPPTTSTDKTMEYLLGLKVIYPEPTQKGPTKLSKSQPVDVPVFVYNFTLKQGE